MDGMIAVRDTVNMVSEYDYASQVLVASVRSPMHVVESGAGRGAGLHHPFQNFGDDVQAPLDRQRYRAVHRRLAAIRPQF